MTTESSGRSGIAIIADTAELDERADPNVWRADLDARHARTARQFLRIAALALEFPNYYGNNWNAFYECFSDLLEVTEGGMGHEFCDREGRTESALHLVVLHAEDLLVDAEPRDFSLLLWKLQHPHHEYDPPQPWHRYADLHVTLVCDPAALESFGTRFDAADRGVARLWD